MEMRKQVWHEVDSEVVEYLIKQLSGLESGIASFYRKHIWSRSPKLVRGFLPKPTTSRGYDRMKAAFALGKCVTMRDTVAPHLIKALKEPEGCVGSEALESLLRLDIPSTLMIPIFHQSSTNSHRNIRRTAQLGLQYLYSESPEAWNILLGFFTDKDTDIREGAFIGLSLMARQGNDVYKAIPLLENILKNGDSYE